MVDASLGPKVQWRMRAEGTCVAHGVMVTLVRRNG